MTLSPHFAMMLLAVICFLSAAINRPASSISPGWLGLFFWALDLLIR